MIYEKINLSVDYSKANLPLEGLTPTLECYAYTVKEETGDKKRPAVVICPGGGYDYCSEREAEFIALKLVGAGICAFVLRYSCVKKRFPTATLEAAAAMKYVKDNAKKYDIDPELVYIAGFSAGGHLAASLSVFWDKEFIWGPLGCSVDDIKPAGQILSYPVITSGKHCHEGSILNLIGEEQSEELRALMSLENQVSEKTPKAFIWHCADDGCVPVQNSLLYMNALIEHGILYECHIYENGGHGLGLCDFNTASWGWEGHFQPVAAKWADLAIDWIMRSYTPFTRP